MQLTIKCILNHKTDVSFNTFYKVVTSLSEICSSERQSPNREMIKYWVKMDEWNLVFRLKDALMNSHKESQVICI